MHDDPDGDLLRHAGLKIGFRSSVATRSCVFVSRFSTRKENAPSEFVVAGALTVENGSR